MKGLLIAWFMGGALGSVGRLLLSQLISVSYFPWATLLSNAIGCALIGFLWPRFFSKDSFTWAFWATGFCGGLTTFSLFSYELISLLQKAYYGHAIAYLALSFLLTIPLLAITAQRSRRLHSK